MKKYDFVIFFKLSNKKNFIKKLYIMNKKIIFEKLLEINLIKN